MAKLRLLYRDVDRTPYLFTLRQCGRRYGLELEMERAALGPGPWAERLEAEDVDVIAENYWGLQNNRAKGAPFIAFGSVSNTLPERLLGNASVRTIEDLRGKKLAVRATGPQALFPEMWLRDHGLEARPKTAHGEPVEPSVLRQAQDERAQCIRFRPRL